MNTNTGKSQHVSRHSNGLNDLRRKLLPASLFSVLGLFACGGEAWAGGAVAANATPTGGTIVGGSGAISQNGANTTIVQKSQMLALNWQSFNVGANASVLFKQPSFTSVALNRILDQNPSQIFGHVNANGQIFLINTHGIIFGAGSQMNVGGLVASTLDLTPSDFLANHFNLDAHGGSAGIVNHGTIEAASGGSVSLIGGQVENDGVILANYGHINLDGADRAVLDFDGDGLINVQVTGALQKRLNADEAAVTNKGKLQADSGTVVLQASAAKDLFTNLVNNTGVVEAGGITTRGGKVQLIASGGNTVTSGTIDVSGSEGGSVQVLSDQNVGVTGTINASGTQGGGSIRVGGGYQGGEGLQTANATYVAPSATLNADATQSGNGGSVVVWGNQANNFYGSISARGGAVGGDGGLIETSAHDGLNVQGSADASAAHGKAGTWLLDPYDVTIQTSGTASFTNPFTASSTSTISASNVNSALTGGTNVFVYTNNSGTGTDNGDITVNAPITAAGSASLYLKAAGSILVNSDITGLGAGNPLNVHLWANYGGSATSTSYSNNTSCGSTTACAVIVGDAASASIKTYGGDVDIHTTGAVQIGNGASNGTIDTTASSGTGALSVTSKGFTETAGSQITTRGNVTINAGSAAATLDNAAIGGNLAVTTTGSANIQLGNGATASLSTGGSQNYTPGGGIILGGATTLSSTGTGNAGAISFNGTVDGGYALSVATAGPITFGSTVGANTSLASLSTSGAGNVTLDGDVTTTGAQNYQDAVTLGNNVALATTNNGILTFGSTVDGASASNDSLTISTGTGGINFNGAVGGTTKLGDVAISSTGTTTLGALNANSLNISSSTGSTTLNGNVTTTNGQTYGNAVLLGGSATLNGSTLSFNGAVDGGYALTATSTGSITFNGAVGTNTALASLSTPGTGGVRLNGNISTAGAQNYQGAVTLGNDLTLSTTGGAVTFGSTVDSASVFIKSLAINTNNGNIAFNDVAGGTNGLNNVTINSGTGTTTLGTFNANSLLVSSASGGTTLNGDVTTNNGQTYANAVTLGNAPNLTVNLNGSTVSLAAVNGASGQTDTLNINGNATLNGAIANLYSLFISGTTALDTSSVATTGGGQTYSGTTTLGTTATLTDTGGATSTISLGRVTGSSYGLTVQDTGGAISFGSSVTLGSLNTSSGTFSSSNSGLTIGTSGSGNLSVTTTNAGISQSGAFSVQGTSTFNASGNAITLTNSSNNFVNAVSLTGSNATLKNNVATQLGASLLSGLLTVTSFNGAISQVGALSVGTGSTFNAGSNAITLSNTGNSFGGTVKLTGGTTQIGSNAAGLTLGQLATGDLTVNSLGSTNLGYGSVGLLNVTSNGAITQSSNTAALTVAGAASFTQTNTTNGTGQDILLNNANNQFKGTIGFAATGTGAQINNLTLFDKSGSTGALTLPASIGGNLTLDYTGSAPGLVLPAATAGGALSVGGTVNVTDANGITLNGNLISVGAQTYAGPVMLGANVILQGTGTGSGISFANVVNGLNGSNNYGLTLEAEGNVAFTGGASGLAALSVTTTGAISQSAGIGVTGNSIFNAGSGAITLTDSNNNFAGTVSLTGGATQINNNAALTLGTLSTGALTVTTGLSDALNLGTGSISGDLTATAGGAISQAGALSVSGSSTITAGAGQAITLTNGNNAFTGAVLLSGGAAQITNNTALLLGDSNVSSLAVISNGSITQDDSAGTTGLNVSGTASFQQNSNNTDIVLDNAGNDFQGLVSFTAGPGAQIRNLTLFNADTNPLGANLSLPASVGGNLTINYSGSQAALTVPAATTTIGGALDLTATKGITIGANVTTGGAQTYHSAVSLGGNVALQSTGGGAITLAKGVNAAADTLTLDTSSSVTIGGSTATDLLGLTSSSGSFSSGALNIGSSGLSVATTSGPITQSGAFIVTGNGSSSFNAGGNAITLINTGNSFSGAVSLNGGATQITNSTALTLGGGIIQGDLVANASGPISQTGALSVSGASTFNAGTSNAITLTNPGNAFSRAVSLTGSTTQILNGGTTPLVLGTLNTGALTASSGGSLNLGSGTVNGTLTATGSGLINQSGALTVNSAAVITQNGGGKDVQLDNAGNLFKSSVSFAGTIGNLSFANAYASSTPLSAGLPPSISGNLTLDYANAPLILPGTAVGGALNVTANGITINGNETTGGGQTYNSAVTLGADATLHSTGSGNIDFASTVDGAHVLTLSTGGDVTLGGAATLTGLASTSNTFSGNALTIGSGGLSITTTGGAILQTGAFTVTGSSAFNAGGNAITLTNGGNNFAGAVALIGGTTQISQGSALTLGAVRTGSLTVSSQGDLNLGSGSVSGDLAATSGGGAISEGGALSVSGNSTLNAGTNAITLTNAGNAFGGAVNLTGGATQINDVSALSLGVLNTGDLTATSNGNLNLGSGNVGGNLVATSNGGAINQTGALAVAGTTALNAGNGAISLTDSGNTFTGAVTATGAGVALNDAGDLTVASLTDNANGSVALTAGGTLTAYGISAGSGDIALASNGGTLSTGGAISGGNISLTGHNGITSTNSITASGSLTMTSANGAITSAGGLSAGTLTGSSAGATALNGTNTIGTLGTFSANGFSLSNGQSLTVTGPITGNGSTTLTVTSGDLTLNGLVSGTSTALNAAGNINQGSGGGIVASTLSGGAGGAANLSGSANQIGALGNFGASHFTLLDGPALTINGTVNGGTSTAITVSNGGLTIKGAVLGTTTTLNAAGAIIENGGSITAGTLSGGAAGAATLDGNNQVGALGNFSANGFSLNDGQALTVNGSVNGNSSTALTTTSGGIAINGTVIGTTVALNSAGPISEGSNGIQAGTLTGSSIGATTLNGANQIGSLGPFTANNFSLTDAQALVVNGAVSGGSSLALTTTSGGIAINSAVSGTATSLNAAGALSEGAGGSITAATLSGNASGVTTLTGANKVGTLGGFRSLSGFSFVDDQSLTLSSLNGSSYVVDAGTSPLSIAVTHGNLYQTDHSWSYDGNGSWSASGAIGTQANPIYVTGVGTQYVTLVGDPPAYFYAVDRNGNILSIIGDSVNVPTSLFSSRAQNVNNHLDSYIDASVITANYRSFGIVPSGILLPPDQQSCQTGGGADCSEE